MAIEERLFAGVDIDQQVKIFRLRAKGTIFVPELLTLKDWHEIQDSLGASPGELIGVVLEKVTWQDGKRS